MVAGLISCCALSSTNNAAIRIASGPTENTAPRVEEQATTVRAQMVRRVLNRAQHLSQYFITWAKAIALTSGAHECQNITVGRLQWHCPHLRLQTLSAIWCQKSSGCKYIGSPFHKDVACVPSVRQEVRCFIHIIAAAAPALCRLGRQANQQQQGPLPFGHIAGAKGFSSASLKRHAADSRNGVKP